VTPALAVQVLDRLEAAHPEAKCALDWRTPFELSVATILSAQCTDERVNQVTPALFARFPTARALAAAPAEQVEEIIRPTGFFRAKGRSIVGFAKGLLEHHQGDVPRDMEAMVRLPGIGRKTANVVLGHAYDMNEGVAVDTHVLRVTNRLGWVASDDPIEIERELMRLVPRERWTRTTDLLIFHGRKICQARRPDCGHCPVFDLCRWPSRQAFAAATNDPPRAPRSAAGSGRRTGARAAAPAGPRAAAGTARGGRAKKPRPRR
jgi:endonuclease-3